MTYLKDVLKDARDEVEFMIRKCAKDEYLFLAQLRTMQWNLKRLEDLVTIQEKIMSYVRNAKKITRSK